MTTGHVACDTTYDDTLPSTIRLSAPSPREPMTMTEASTSSAKAQISLRASPVLVADRTAMPASRSCFAYDSSVAADRDAIALLRLLQR
jgi:hypothetical protein